MNEIGLTEFSPEKSIWVIIQHLVSIYMLVIIYSFSCSSIFPESETK